MFADPPFNLGKNYGNKSNDSLADSEYLNWCFAWINECCRILKPGGSLFIYNLPKWNIWIGVEIQNCDVIIERLSEGNLDYHKNNDYVEG
ncbi:MAG: DNA methyltransferase [Microcoleaceae cyanobacterium MO_207.B10]|nr:DNA methyltransferase [Microcoleaceae cyanobacterium MO_207.B10]